MIGAPTWCFQYRGQAASLALALLRACGRDIRRHLVTQLVPLAEAPALLAELAERRRPVQTVFTVEQQPPSSLV